jgi:hypothetical protein
MERQTIVAFGVLGVVIALLGAVAVVRVSDAGGFRGALTSDWLDYGSYDDYDEYGNWDENDWEQCNSLAVIAGVYDRDDDGVAESRYDHHSETRGAEQRSSSLSIIKYDDSTAASLILARRQQAAKDGKLAGCLAALEDSTHGKQAARVITAEGTVGWSMVFSYSDRTFRREFLTWLDHDRVVNLELVAPESDDSAEWIRGEYKRVTEEIERAPIP